MSYSRDIDKNVGFWIKGVPYIWRHRDNKGREPADWKDWQRSYIFLENDIGNLLPETCQDDVRAYFNFISKDQYDYEINVSPDFDWYQSVVRIEGEDIDINNQRAPMYSLHDYQGKKLLKHIVPQFKK